MDVAAAYRQVDTHRGAAQLCGTTHKTAKRVIERVEAGDGPARRRKRPRNYAEVVTLVAERVDKSKGRVSAQRPLPVARAAGYAGSGGDRGLRCLRCGRTAAHSAELLRCVRRG